MTSKKLCAIDILDIDLNFILYKSQAEKYNFNINNYKKVQDLKNIFYGKNNNNGKDNIDYFKYVFLSSENNVINTLLFINRAYKTKTFIEFIMPNKLDFSENTKFVHKLLTDVCNKNYLFIVENRILDVSSKIKFIIKIIDDETKAIIQYKYFELFEMNDIEIYLNSNKDNNNNNDIGSINDKNDKKNNQKKQMKMLYNFDKADYFLIDLFSFKELIWKNKHNMLQIIYNIINNNKNIIIILIINDKCFKGIQFNDLIDIYKEIIELSDIIFCNKNDMNYFFKIYYELKNVNKRNIITNLVIKTRINNKMNVMRSTLADNNNSFPKIYKNKKNIPQSLLNIKDNDLDLIVLDSDKHRKNIPRISVLLDKFDSATIYSQSGAQMEVDYSDIFYFKLNSKKLDVNKDNKEILEKIFYYFIGGFLSRYINNKNFRVCFYAGFLLLQKLIKNSKKRKIVFNIDDYNVLVPNEKQTPKEKIIQKFIKIFNEKTSKEKGFILDCTNVNESKIKNYNPLLDNNCASYLLKKDNLILLKRNGFINKNGIILKDPGNYEKPKNNTTSKKKFLKPLFIELNNINKTNNFNRNILNTIQISNIKNKEMKDKKYSKTINNFYRLNNKKTIFLDYQKYNKPNTKFKNYLTTNKNKKRYLTLMSKTSQNFRFNYIKISSSPIQKTKKTNLKERLGLSNNKNNNIINNQQIKLPKYDKYRKYLFQLYRPDFNFNDFLKNEEPKKKTIKRTYSQ